MIVVGPKFIDGAEVEVLGLMRRYSVLSGLRASLLADIQENICCRQDSMSTMAEDDVEGENDR
jgi:hypothetical protein